MKTLGIQINGNSAVFSAIDNSSSNLTDITGSLRKLELKDDLDSKEVRNFYDVVSAYLDSMSFDRLAILKRVKSVNARFPPSPISFKLEGILQLYPASDFLFVAPQTLTAFYRTHEFNFTSKFDYQQDATRLAYYLLMK